MTATVDQIIRSAYSAFRPRPSGRTLDWAKANIVTDNGSPFDSMAYPHHGAPGGPFDAIDNINVLTVWLQWASRLGKTFIGQCSMMKWADCSPCPMMFASSDQKLAVEVTARTYRMLERCPPLRGELRNVNRRKQDCVELVYCRQYVAWARSVSTLADKAVQLGHANEVDKWERASTSTEADPLKLFTDRFKEFPVHKKIIESTPSVKGKSRVERGLLGSTNCRLHVPCPHCGSYQQLRLGDGESPGGIVWDKRDGGKHDKELARSTARYICERCSKEIGNDSRGRMMRLGVWCPEGCTVDDAWAAECATEWRKPDQPKWKGWKESPWIVGEPLRDGRDAGYQLSSLYALQLSWGDIAAEFVDCLQRPANMQNFVNQWKGETWEPVKRSTNWEILGQKTITQTPRGVMPEWASMVTIGIDRQEDKFPWAAVAWGQEMQPYAIAYGHCETFEQVAEIIKTYWPHFDGGKAVRSAWTLFDSGFRPVGADGVYQFCDKMFRDGLEVWPSKGSNTSLSTDYTISFTGKNTARPGTRLYMMDTNRTQAWIEAHLQAGTIGLFRGSLHEHQDYLEQVLNDAPKQELDSSNQVRESWERINVNIPNDYRDCIRNAYVAMLLATRGGRIMPRKYDAPSSGPKQPQEPSRVRELRIRRR